MRIRAAAAVLAVAVLALAASAAGGHGLRRGAQPAPSLFGINTGTFDSSYKRFVRDMPTARQMGARWIHLTGANIKFPHGRLSFAQMDSQVNRARSLGLGVLMSLGGVKGACSSHASGDVTSCPPTSAHDLAAYGRYLRKLFRHFKGRTAYYESWVEPNQRSSWAGHPDPAQYARLLVVEARALRSVDPHAKLLFASLNSFGSEDDTAVLVFVHAALDDLHGARAFDGVALHPYRYPPVGPDAQNWDHVPVDYPASGCTTHPWCQMDWVGELTAYEQEFTNHGYGRPPMWLSEFGWPGNAHAGDAYHPDLATQATDLERAYRLLLGDQRLDFVKAAFWFNLRDYQPGYPNPDPEFFGHYGLLYNDFGAKPAAAEFEHFAHGGR